MKNVNSATRYLFPALRHKSSWLTTNVFALRPGARLVVGRRKIRSSPAMKSEARFISPFRNHTPRYAGYRYRVARLTLSHRWGAVQYRPRNSEPTSAQALNFSV